MAANDPWNSSFEANPTNSDDAGQGDDEILESRQRARYRLRRELNVGDSSIAPNKYVDSGRLLPGAGRAYLVDGTAGTPLTALPTTLLFQDMTAQTLTIGGVGAALGTEDEGRLAVIDGSIVHWDGSAWVAMPQDSDATASDHQTTISSTTAGSPDILEKSAGVELKANVSVGNVGASALGLLCIRVTAAFMLRNSAGSNNCLAGFRLVEDPSGAASTTDVWLAAHASTASIDISPVTITHDFDLSTGNVDYDLKVILVKSGGTFDAGAFTAGGGRADARIKARVTLR